MTPKSKAIIVITICLVAAILLTADFALAAEFRLVDCAGGKDKCTITDLLHVFIRVINFFIAMAWMFTLFFIFWGSYGIAASYGNSEKIEIGKKTIQNAFIGFFLVMIAFILINFVFIALTGMNIRDILEFLPIKK